MTTLTPGTDLTFAASSLQDRMQWSKAIAGAGNLVPAGFRDGPNANPAKILLAVEYGVMLGLSPMAALSGIHVIDGRPTLSAALMSALVHKAGHKLRITTTGSVTGSGNNLGGDFEVTATLIRRDDPDHPFTATWTIDRAKRAGLWGKGNWQKYPENQMTWRAVSEDVRNGAPEVLLGIWHTPDELGAAVDEDGDVIDAEEVEQGHDGPNVVATMRENSNATRKVGDTGKRGHTTEREVVTRAVQNDTPSDAKRPGGSRTASKSAAGSAEPTRDKAIVFNEWASRVDDTQTIDALIQLHAEAAERNTLDHAASRSDGTVTTLEDVFLARREELLSRDAALAEPDVEESDEDFAETLPF